MAVAVAPVLYSLGVEPAQAALVGVPEELPKVSLYRQAWGSLQVPLLDRSRPVPRQD